jgi:alpha-beta hydrolase superfamily lysophospholipase
MPRRLAAATSLVAFAVCLLLGIAAENTLSTTLSRALVAMVGTLVVGLVVGAMGQRMLEENVKAVKAKRAEEEQQRLQQEPAQKPPAGQKQPGAKSAPSMAQRQAREKKLEESPQPIRRPDR